MGLRNLAGEVEGITTDDGLIEAWLAGRPETTARVYRFGVRRFREQVRKRLRDITPSDVATYAELLDGKPSTQVKLVMVVKSLLTFAHRSGYLPTNPGASVRVSSLPRTPGRGLTEREVYRLITGAEPGRDRTLVRFMYLSGCRVSETCGLSLTDIAADHVTVLGKLNKPREVPLPDELLRDLRALGRTSPGGSVFASHRGRRLAPRSLRWVVATLGRRVLGKPINPLMFRHAHTTHALEAGAPAHHVQRCLGHESLHTTGMYVDATPGANSAAFLDATLTG